MEHYRGGRPPLDARGRTAIVVDDGLGTGETARAALPAVRAQGPRRLMLAVPVRFGGHSPAETLTLGLEVPLARSTIAPR